jgi:ribosome-binding factor A
MSESHRSERVAEMVMRELGAMLTRELRDPRLRGVTITEVRMTDDLRQCRVFFSHIEGSVKSAAALAGFRSAAGFIRREIGKVLGLRYTPELEFEFDPGLERAARIDAILKDADRAR